ncbi:MAG TPA: hypothetical protein V6C81_05290 [Planktothrix sp.]|jgi:hypothetical protein
MKFNPIAITLSAAAVCALASGPAWAGDGGGAGAGVLSGITNYSMSRREASQNFTAAPVVPSSLLFNTGTGTQTTTPATADPGAALSVPATGFANPNDSAQLELSNPVMTLSGSGSLGGASFPAKANDKTDDKSNTAAATSKDLPTPEYQPSNFALRAIMPESTSANVSSQMGSNNYESGLYEPDSWIARFNRAKAGEPVH